MLENSLQTLVAVVAHSELPVVARNLDELETTPVSSHLNPIYAQPTLVPLADRSDEPFLDEKDSKFDAVY
jgi:hypothetical protein